jgi:hypothetical protein
MKYTAPSILTTQNAGVAIQDGTDPNQKSTGGPDNANPQGLSPNPAYEADE